MGLVGHHMSKISLF